MIENKSGKKVLSIENVLTVVLVLSILLCGTITVQVLLKGYASFGKFSFFRVVTGSMEPAVPTGALLVCEDIDIEDVVIGDIVCFRAQDKYMKGNIITHRVCDIKRDSNSEVRLFTKGDANLSEDGYTTGKETFIGKVKWYTEEGSFFIGFVRTVSSKTGFLACIVFPILLISSFVLNECTKSIMRDLEEANAQLEQNQEEVVGETELSQDEYMEMYNRIKEELMEELGIREE